MSWMAASKTTFAAKRLGGAAATPLTTFTNQLDNDLYIDDDLKEEPKTVRGLQVERKQP